ncbi:hypothetical protein HPB52_006655 [Rhipicephalus sanguineus]|uniref:Peptidase M13 C-terminal domain-containing protein n=1 Tax=Rhipicephalus sanguineus TaxID=34632 RepID=A0A9D4PVZ7_RHISA|nr:hypothetical protein HPB52_006655 [Rhipicephalus sanguineus]
MLSGTIRGLGHMTDPHVTPAKWSTVFAKYTSNTYNGSNTIAYQKYVLDILVDLINHHSVGVEGLRYLIAWSMFRQLVRYTEPTLLLGKKTAREACYDEVLEVMKLAVVSPFLQTTPLPDVLPNRFFASWRKALSLSRHQQWADQHTWLYDEAEVDAEYSVHFNSIIIPTAMLQPPFFFFDSPPALNYGGIGTLRMRSEQEMVNDTLDSENLADFVGTLTAYAAFASLPPPERDIELSGLNMTAEQIFFISRCVQWCEQEPLIGDRYAPSRSRCLVPLMNMPQFSAAFACPSGTPMNPRKKCTFW